MFYIVFVFIPVVIVLWWAWCVIKYKKTDKTHRSYGYRKKCLIASSVLGILSITWLTLMIVAFIR